MTETTSKFYDRFVWDFGGDGSSQFVSGNTVMHTFSKLGTHNVKVSTSDYVYSYSKPLFVVYKIGDAVFSHLYGAQVLSTHRLL